MLDALFAALSNRGFELIGPTVRDGAIVYDGIATSDDLPVGWTDEQDGGHYRLKRRNDAALFGYAVGPHSWKNFLHPSHLRLWQARREAGEVRIETAPVQAHKLAFIAARSCDLEAVAIQDKVWVVDPDGNSWEVFVVLEADVPQRATVGSSCCAVPAAEAGLTPASCCGSE